MHVKYALTMVILPRVVQEGLYHCNSIQEGNFIQTVHVAVIIFKKAYVTAILYKKGMPL
jgi:hypothetical protein